MIEKSYLNPLRLQVQKLEVQLPIIASEPAHSFDRLRLLAGVLLDENPKITEDFCGGVTGIIYDLLITHFDFCVRGGMAYASVNSVLLGHSKVNYLFYGYDKVFNIINAPLRGDNALEGYFVDIIFELYDSFSDPPSYHCIFDYLCFNRIHHLFADKHVSSLIRCVESGTEMQLISDLGFDGFQVENVMAALERGSHYWKGRK